MLESNRRLSFSFCRRDARPCVNGRARTGNHGATCHTHRRIVISGSAFSVLIIRKPEAAPEGTRDVPLLSEALDGFRFIWAHPALRALLLRSVTAFLSHGFDFSAVFVKRHSSSAHESRLWALSSRWVAGSVAGAYLPHVIYPPWAWSDVFRHRYSDWFCAIVDSAVGTDSLAWDSSASAYSKLVADMAWTIDLVNETTLRICGAVAGLRSRNAAISTCHGGMLPFGHLRRICSSGLEFRRICISWGRWGSCCQRRGRRLQKQSQFGRCNR